MSSKVASEMMSQNEYIAKVTPIRIQRDTRGVSRELPQDPFYDTYADGILEPPYDMFTLAVMPEVSSELGPAIDAMVVNIAKMGYRIIPRDGISNSEEELDILIKQERAKIKNFFANAILESTETFTTFRANMRYDLETTGNAYFEILPNLVTIEPAGLNHLPSWQMRLYREDDEMTECVIRRAIEGVDGKWTIQDFPYKKRFRRYVQIRDNMTEKVYFKEYNDPRLIDNRDGHVFSEEELNSSEFNPNTLATEVVHVKLYCPRSPYGLPRWIGNLFTIFGNRAAEVINYTTFRNNNIPALMLLATNVQLTEASIERIQKFVEERIQGDDNYSTILLVEGEPMTEGMKDPGNMKLEIKELVQAQHTDAMFVKYMERGDDKIRRTFRLPPIFLGRCVSIDTEFLTENGWKYFDDIDTKERIATINSKTGMLEFQIPTERYRYDYDGQMFQFNNDKAINALVTPNHRMMYRCNSDNWNFKNAYEMPNWHVDILLSSIEWNGSEIEKYKIDRELSLRESKGLIYSHNQTRDYERSLNYEQRHEVVGNYFMDDFLELIGYFVSEGSTSNVRGPISISQNIGDVFEKIKNVISRIGFDYGISGNRGDERNINFCYVPLWQWLRENCGTCSINKKFPREFLNLSRRQLQILYIALMNGDGSWSDNGCEYSGTYSTTSKQLADLFQELCFRLGYRTSLRLVDRSSYGWENIYVICISSKPINHVLNIDSCLQVIRYCGDVCCFTTQNGTIVTRYKGRVLVSGNSEDYTRATVESSRRIAEEQVFKPERNEEDIIWNQTIIPALNAANVVFRSNTPDVTDNYELTQLLAVAEQSGGLSPVISRIIVEDVLGRDLPPIDSSIPANIPFSLTMLREQVNAQLEESGISSDDAVVQLEKLKMLMNGNEDISEDIQKSISTLISLLKTNKVKKIKPSSVSVVDSSVIDSTELTKTIREVDGQYCVFSEDGDHNFGCYDTMSEAEDRLAQIERYSEKNSRVPICVFKADESEQHIIGGAVLVPGVVDLQGDMYDADVVESAAYYWLEHYMDDPSENGIKFMHKDEVISDAARPIQSWVLDRDMDFDVDVSIVDDDHPSKSLTTLSYPKGTWMLYARISDDKLWGKFKSGELTGWSIGGVALVQHLKQMRNTCQH